MKNLRLLLIGFCVAAGMQLHAQDMVVYNFRNEADQKEFKERNLDETHKDLMDPRVSQGQIQTVRQTWIEFHKAIGKFMAEKNFSWDTESEKIDMYQRIYFNPDGSVKAHLFRVFNDSVSDEKAEEFSDVLEEFGRIKRGGDGGLRGSELVGLPDRPCPEKKRALWIDDSHRKLRFRIEGLAGSKTLQLPEKRDW